MSGRTSQDRRSQASSRGAGKAPAGVAASDPSAPPPRRRGPHLGPIAITPLRVMLLVALLGGAAFLAWSVFVRDQLQVPLMATGFAVIGLVFAAIAILAFVSVIRAGRDGRDGTAVMTALAGGLVAVAALLSLAAATIMSLLWSGASRT